MEDGQWLDKDDKMKLESLIKELETLKSEHKSFAKKKSGGLSPEEREKWRVNSRRTEEVHTAIKDLRLKNILEAGRG